MAGASQNAKADPNEVKRAKGTWVKFTEATKWSVIACVVILVLLAVFVL